MPEEVTNDLIYAVLQKMQADVAEIKFDLRDIKVRTTMLEEHLGGTLIAMSGVNSRLDRLNDRVDRIESRLELAEAR